mmetsp:Transcript_10073/g.9027  ORF Transcript_10073/g.9027 Transcript_10073/m.9027 type:complete len:220 (+) Transcript_10073:16-675(+)
MNKSKEIIIETLKSEDSDDDIANENKFKPSKNYSYRLSKHQLVEIKEIFDALDDDYDGIISIDLLNDALRASGVLISNKELENLTAEVITELDPYRTSSTDSLKLDLSTFMMYVTKKLRDTSSLEKMTAAAFAKLYISIDSDGSEIPLTNLRSVLSSYGGELLTEEEMDTIVFQLKNSGKVSLATNTVKTQDLIALINQPLQDIIDSNYDEDETRPSEF